MSVCVWISARKFNVDGAKMQRKYKFEHTCVLCFSVHEFFIRTSTSIYIYMCVCVHTHIKKIVY